jgi:hypothetical protein
MKLKYREVKPLREKMLKEQEYKCKLCEEPITDLSEAVLDHDHKTGQIRAVLHRGCNAFLGKVENSLVINRISQNRLKLIFDNYWRYIDTLQPLVHPTHKEPKQKSTNRRNKTNDTNVSIRRTKNTSK